MLRQLDFHSDAVSRGFTAAAEDLIGKVATDPALARSVQGTCVIAFPDHEHLGPLESQQDVLRFVRLLHERIVYLFYFLQPDPRLGHVSEFLAAFGTDESADGVAQLGIHLGHAAAFADRVADDGTGIVGRLLEPVRPEARAVVEEYMRSVRTSEQVLQSRRSGCTAR
jgi:hypothetical protein